MIKFTLDVNLHKLNVENAQLFLKKISEKIEEFNLSTNKIQDVWNDESSNNFLKNFNSDIIGIDTYINNFSKRLLFVNDFLNEIENTFKNKKYEKVYKIIYYDKYIKSSLDFMNNMLKGINEINKIVENIYIPDDYEDKAKLTNTLNEYKIIYDLLNQYITDINSIALNIEKICSYYKEKIYNLDDVLTISLQDNK